VVVPGSTLRAGADDSTKGSRQEEVYIVGKDLLQLLEKDPEAVILVGESARKYMESAKLSGQGATASVIVQQCEIRGELFEELARLRVEITARNDSEAPRPMPIALSEAILISVSVDGGPPFLTRDNQGWVVWVEGRGKHSVVAEVQLPIIGSKTLASLACGIPEAPITSLDLMSRRPVGDVRVTPAAAVTMRQTAELTPRIEVALGPRNKLDLRWRWEAQGNGDTAPLLRAKSQVTAEVEPEGIQIKTELRIQSLRGGQQTVELRNSPDERVLDVQTTDGKVVGGWQTSVEGGVQRVLLHYTEPLSGTSELVINSERPWTAGKGTIRGWVVHGAYSHWSLVALRSVPELDIAVTGMENAQPTEMLPATLRSPRNEAAFASYAQPYALALSILPRRAHTTVRSSVGVSYGEELSSIAARWQFTVHGGKISQVDFLLPAHFQADHFLFSDSVLAIRQEETPGGRLAHIFLRGTPDEFEVRLRAAIPLPAARNLVKLELPSPRDTQSELSRLYLAGTPDIDLDPTPNLLPVNGSSDDALVRELVGTGGSFHAFECRSLLDQVAFRLSKSAAVLWYQTHVQLRFDEESALVHQTFDFAAQGAPPRQLRFEIPQPIRGAVRTESAPIGSSSDVGSDDLVVRLGPQPADPLRVQISYRSPYSQRAASDSSNIVVPLVRVANAQCELTEVAISAPRHIHLRVEGDGWQTLSAANSQRTVKMEDARWLLRRAGPASRLELNKSDVSWLPQAATVVQRVWHETIVDSQGQWRTRSRFVLTESDPSRLRARIPPDGRLTRVRCNGQVIPVRPGPATDTVELLATVPGETPVVLEMELDGTAPIRTPTWGRLVWDVPVLLGDVVWGKVFWQVELPEGMAVLRGPAGYSDENDTRWRDASLRLTPRQDENSLERWLTGSTELRVAAASGQRLLYSRLLSTGPLQMTVVSRWLLVLFSSSLVMVIGLSLVALPQRGKLLLVIAVILATTILAATEPQAATECARSAGWGLLLAVLAGVSHVLLTRRRTNKQSVFPQPAQLANVRVSSSRGSTDSDLNAGELPVSAAGPAGAGPRLAASSSSVRG
jgi:hypothetical protein